MSGTERTASVAIVIRTKDRPEFLRRALVSIVGQSFGDWQAVIVNDGGDPALVRETVAELDAEQQAKFRFVDSAESRGRWVSANAGVLATTAPLLVLHDDDDTWHPEFLARATAYLEQRPERVGVVARIERLWEERDASGVLVPVRREVFQGHLANPTLSAALLFNRFVPIGYLYRRSLHEEFGLYEEALPVIGDWDFNLRVLSKHSLEFLEGEPLAYWHHREGVTGSAGNSVIHASDDHVKYDELVRDEALREFVDQFGLGLPLYLTKFVNGRIANLERQLRREIREEGERTRAEMLRISTITRLKRLARRGIGSRDE
ncbi:glycosyltransferase family 2 protein [Leucobacter iarius]|uniref:Glycosyltransferase 2-like domain-containing protein n=1 Tax=Leucobacter iarius TaxID=333963 RepID=A0ABP4XIV9_9MICO